MSAPASPRGLAHLVGSVPLASAEDVFRTVTGALGDCLSRVPDGETGERRRWIWWQREMLERHPAMEVDREAGLLELRQWDGSLLRRSELLRLKPGVDASTVKFRTGYAEAALASWRLFETLRRRGDVAGGVRFQVALPTPMSSAFMYVSPRSHDDYLRAYERALLEALGTIVAAVPAEDLSIQWDVCQEVLVFEDYFPSRPPDYRERNWHFERVITPGCLFCHTNRFHKAEGKLPVFHGLTIGCENASPDAGASWSAPHLPC